MHVYILHIRKNCARYIHKCIHKYIYSLRTREKRAWKRGLVAAAAHGPWGARRLLSRRVSKNADFAARALVAKHGSREAAAVHVERHFHDRLGSCTEIPTSFLGLADSEPDFTLEEVATAVRKLKPGKATGMSRVSSELLKAFLVVPFGLYVLCLLLNDILHYPEPAHADLAVGWVFLVPKKHVVDDASGFRPIVCGEVFLKLAACLATFRLTAFWPVPPSCFGSVPGKGLPEALYILQHAAQTSAGFQDTTIFLQLDLSQAFDSLHINAILNFVLASWSPASAMSASLLRWVLLHSCLRFQFLDSVWWCQQTRGTQQGGSHSPTLFGRIVAARFAELTAQWELEGEVPPYSAGLLLLWVLWFIDDSVLLFRNVA